ncbi:MAG: recombinase family protein [Proteobacteria bacterium]|nr:recombinase family protein [Pseudomonadota bacterium]
MSEFLKNFRSTHSRYAGNKRNPYDGHYYSAQERRVVNDRRNDQGQPASKPSASLFGKLEDLLPKIHTLLETMTENQQHLISLKERQTTSSELMAAAFKDIASMLKTSDPSAIRTVHLEKTQAIDDESPTLSVKDLENTEMVSSADEKRDVIKIMKKLRKKGGTYKEIAHFLNENNIATFSNKGHWHAQTIHRLCSR